MIYENKSTVDNICLKIASMEELLIELDSDVSVVLKSHHSFMTIGTWETCDHPYKELAAEMIDNMKAKVNSEINKLKDMLADL